MSASVIATVDHFERLGLPRRFALDPRALEDNYLERSRALHPDVHQLGSTNDRRLSLELSAALNDAYATLKEPFRRAEYLLQLEGGPSAADHKEMDPAFLEEMLELRMEIEELRETGQPDSPAMAAMENQLLRRRDALLREIADRFEKLERTSVEEKPKQSLLRETREFLNAARYIQGLLRDMRAD